MTEEQVAKKVAETMAWAAARADFPALTGFEVAEGEPTVVLCQTVPEGELFALKVEAF